MAKYKNLTMMEYIKCTIIRQKIPDELWPEIFLVITHISKLLPHQYSIAYFFQECSSEFVKLTVFMYSGINNFSDGRYRTLGILHRIKSFLSTKKVDYQIILT